MIYFVCMYNIPTDLYLHVAFMKDQISGHVSIFPILERYTLQKISIPLKILFKILNMTDYYFNIKQYLLKMYISDKNKTSTFSQK